MIIALASDHNGTILKNGLVNLFCERGYYCIDLGPYDDQLVDYVERAKQLAEIVSRGHADRGILVCGTGIGMSIVANKVAGVRAAQRFVCCQITRAQRRHCSLPRLMGQV